MMKRKLLAVVLPLVGCATVVGSGFAAWYFGEIETTGSNTAAQVNVNVTQEVMHADRLLKLESTKDEINGKTLVLDQGGIKSDEYKGIMIGEATDTETVAKTGDDGVDYDFTLTWGGSTVEGDPVEVDLLQIYEAGMKVRLTVSITLGDPLSNYIELVPGYSLICPDSEKQVFGGEGGKVYTAVWEAKKPASKTTTASWKFNLGFDTNADLKNEAFKYIASDTEEGKPGKPNESGEPAAMRNEVKNSKVDIAIKAEVVDTKTGA